MATDQSDVMRVLQRLTSDKKRRDEVKKDVIYNVKKGDHAKRHLAEFR